jgi:hypothetical protein
MTFPNLKIFFLKKKNTKNDDFQIRKYFQFCHFQKGELYFPLLLRFDFDLGFTKVNLQRKSTPEN